MSSLSFRSYIWENLTICFEIKPKCIICHSLVWIYRQYYIISKYLNFFNIKLV